MRGLELIAKPSVLLETTAELLRFSRESNNRTATEANLFLNFIAQLRCRLCDRVAIWLIRSSPGLLVQRVLVFRQLRQCAFNFFLQIHQRLVNSKQTSRDPRPTSSFLMFLRWHSRGLVTLQVE